VSSTRTRIVMITSGFPRISETFALNEFLALDRAGRIEAIFATKPGDGRARHPGIEGLLARVQWLPPGSPVVQADWVVARVGARRPSGIHAYFAHLPAEVAAGAAETLGVPYSFSVHARDARKVPRDALQRRAARAAAVIACNRDVAGELRAGGANVKLVPHGVDLDRFSPHPMPPALPLRLLAVGRLVEKKGFDVLLEAMASLSTPAHLRIVGDGPLRTRLERVAAGQSLGDRVTFAGPLTHHSLPGAFAGAHALVVPSVQDATGDRDGLPNVVLEAMASGRPVVASDIAAIPAAVRDGHTGSLVPPADPIALAGALERLAVDPLARGRMGAAARALVEHEFELGKCAGRLLGCLEAAYA
jgi:glycosyltransferase involved in cell wall biosynthesis